MILNQKSINIDEMRWIVMMTLWKSGKENSYLFVEDSLFQNKRTETSLAFKIYFLLS